VAVSHSPLRYPGGKQVLAHVLSQFMRLNGAHGGTYAEPYAGGAGAALALLYGEHVDRVLINDADPRIFAFWSSLLHQTSRFVRLVETIPITIQEWANQRAIYQQPRGHSTLNVGFSTFYLNRCNRSGIIANGGPIGGKEQKGRWRIDARFNRADLAARIRRIALYRDRIALSKLDGVDFLEQYVVRLPEKARPFVYLDPPYYAKGRDLYLNYYQPDDHGRLAAWLTDRASFPWVLTYDDVPAIAKLYRGFRRLRVDVDYSARHRRSEREVMILKPGLMVPQGWGRGIPRRFVSASDDVAS
jgi:DNA adenine methylase